MEKEVRIKKRKVIVTFDENIEDIIINLHIKKCANCGKLTLVHNKQKYCKECKNISYDKKETTDYISKVYRNNYKNQHNKMARNLKRGKDVRQKFNVWNIKAKEMTKKCKGGELSLEELKVWFKQSQKWNKEN